jgi:hypothetical protein
MIGSGRGIFKILSQNMFGGTEKKKARKELSNFAISRPRHKPGIS